MTPLNTGNVCLKEYITILTFKIFEHNFKMPRIWSPNTHHTQNQEDTMRMEGSMGKKTEKGEVKPKENRK